ncbi:MAG: adenosylcobinamide-phosphate synthase CbiB [Acidimicrobiales bacterium]|jgi:adenosylcobinamide-phosphate synthase
MVSLRPRFAQRAASTAVALALDAWLGDEPLHPHPVALFGTTMTAFERRVWDDRRWPGVAYAACGAGGAAAVGSLLGRLPGGTAAAGYATVAGRGLWDTAASVSSALEQGDLGRARELLPALVGRDPARLSEADIARAVVESVAENTVDGIVAPALFALVAGAPGALAYRGINTLDSMVGYRDERYGSFGWASARLDDLANLVPSRLTALLVVLVSPAAAGEVWRAVRRDAPLHPSPNAGVAEAAFAAALGVRLGGRNLYRGQVSERASMGATGGRAPEAGDIDAAIRLSRRVTAVAFGLLCALAVSSAALDALRRRHCVVDSGHMCPDIHRQSPTSPPGSVGSPAGKIHRGGQK